jgi:hypothetical protein
MKSKSIPGNNGRVANEQAVRRQIEARAFEIFQRRGCEHGRDIEDWIEAEQETLLLLLIEGAPEPATEKGNVKQKRLSKVPERVQRNSEYPTLVKHASRSNLETLLKKVASNGKPAAKKSGPQRIPKCVLGSREIA